MKNFKRIVGLLLCLAMVLTFVPVYHTAQAATSEYVEIEISSAIVGAYDDGATREHLIGEQNAPAIFDGNISTKILVGSANDGGTIDDGWVWNESAQYGYNGSGKYTPVAILTLAEDATLSRIEIVPAKANNHYVPKRLTIQAKIGGAWTTVGTYSNSAWNGATAVIELNMDDDATTNQVRVLVEHIPRLPQDTGNKDTAHWEIPEITLYGPSATTEPTDPPADEGEYTKLDMSGCVVGFLSQNFDSNKNHAEQTWYSDSKESAKNAMPSIVDGDVTDEIHYKVADTERGDFYVDLTKKYNQGVSVNQLKWYYVGYDRSSENSAWISEASSVEVVLVLKNGTKVEKTFNTNWKGKNSAVLTWTFDQTYEVAGVYVWAKQSEEDYVSLGELELYQKTGGSTEPEVPDELGTTPVGLPSIKQIKISADYVHACSLGATDASDYSKLLWFCCDVQSSWGKEDKIVDGKTGSDYLCTFGVGTSKVDGVSYTERPDCYIDLSNGTGGYTDVSNFEMYHGGKYAVSNLEITLLLKDGTKKEKTLNPGWGTSQSATPATWDFGQNYQLVGIYVYERNATGGTFGEINLYQTQTVQLPQPENIQATVDGGQIKVGANVVEKGGKLQFSIDNGATWQDADGHYYTYTKTAGTYTIKARYLATDGYITTTEANYASISVTIKNQLSAPTDAMVDISRTDTTITVVADAVTGGEPRYALVPDEDELTDDKWQASGNFTGLNPYTAYDIYVKYIATDDAYADSAEAGFDVRTRWDTPTNLQYVEVTYNSITVTADYNSKGTLEFQLTTTDGTVVHKWQTSGEFTGLDPSTTYKVYAICVGGGVDYDSVISEALLVTTEAAPIPNKVGMSYSVRLVEPWALRVYVDFGIEEGENVTKIEHSVLIDYGAYVIIEHKFENAGNPTAENIKADSDAIHFAKNAEGDKKITAFNDSETTLYFDFYDDLYTYRMEETIYIVIYYEDAEGVHYKDVQKVTLTGLIDEIEGKASESEAAVLNNMQVLHQSVIDFRGTEANLGNTVYPDPVTLGDSDLAGKNFTTGTYLYGRKYQIRLIEPWGFRVTLRVKDKTAGTIFDLTQDVTDVGMIFYHDKQGKFNGMTSAEMLAQADALVYSMSNGGVTISGDSAIAVFDEGIFTHELNSNLYCLPYVKIGEQYHCQTNATRWNLLDEMTAFSVDTGRKAEERTVFANMVALYNNVQAYLASRN